eukprot:TRINITY_DN2833_c0_g1_i1.p1 TRINITY_DN2833_c0_g1~~TRINITY_DN2833_c0_g1_i1.p1  ORF type:complete len:463 (+),score=92.87 TRINITY_DN2833_c0_g1_i1:129-1517(+)
MEFLVDGDDVMLPLELPFNQAGACGPQNLAGSKRPRSPSPCSGESSLSPVSYHNGHQQIPPLPFLPRSNNSNNGAISDASYSSGGLGGAGSSSFAGGRGGVGGNSSDKKERNRLSAVRYRKKKKQFVDSLQEKVDQLERDISHKDIRIAALSNENAQLREQLGFVRQLLSFAGNSEQLVKVKDDIAAAMASTDALMSSSSAAAYCDDGKSSRDNSSTCESPDRMASSSMASSSPNNNNLNSGRGRRQNNGGVMMLALFAVMFAVTGLNLLLGDFDPRSSLGFLVNQDWMKLSGFSIPSPVVDQPAADGVRFNKRTLMTVDDSYSVSDTSSGGFVDTFGHDSDAFMSLDAISDFPMMDMNSPTVEVPSGSVAPSSPSCIFDGGEFDDFAQRFIQENAIIGSNSTNEEDPLDRKRANSSAESSNQTAADIQEGYGTQITQEQLLPLLQQAFCVLKSAGRIFPKQ